MPLCFDVFPAEIAGRDYRDVKPYHLVFHPVPVLSGLCNIAVHKIDRPGNPQSGLASTSLKVLHGPDRRFGKRAHPSRPVAYAAREFFTRRGSRTGHFFPPITVIARS